MPEGFGTETQYRVPSLGGLGSGLFSQVPCLGDTLGGFGGKVRATKKAINEQDI